MSLPEGMLHIYQFNTGTCHLFDMYALSPPASGIHIWLITRAYVTTITYIWWLHTLYNTVTNSLLVHNDA